MEQSVRSDSTLMSDRQDVRAPSDADARRDAAATALLTALPASPEVVDPIFAAIEKAHALHAVERAAHAVAVDLPDDAPEWGPHDVAYRAWLDHVDSVLLKIIPTTASGCGALARFTVDFCTEEGIALSHAAEAGEVDNFVPLRLIAQSPALMEPSGLALSEGLDTDLLRLGEAWADAFEAEQASYARQEAIAARAPEFGPDSVEGHEAWRSASGMQAEEEKGRQLALAAECLAARIAASRATSVAGLQIKARLVQHYTALEIDPIKGLADGIARDLLAVGTRSETVTKLGMQGSSQGGGLAALGQQFDEAHAAWMALVPAREETSRQAHELARRAIARGVEEGPAYATAWGRTGFTEALSREEDAFCALEPLHRAIMALPAHSVADLAVKARAATMSLWAEGTFEADRTLGQDENWERLLVRDLIDACLALAQRNNDVPPVAKTPETPDLSALTIRQLSNLYDRYVQTADLWCDALHAPWANDPAGAGLRGPNATGNVVEAEEERVARLRDGVANELAQREPPKDRWDRDFRLDAMIRHEMMCNGSLRHAPELRAAITAQWGGEA